MLKSRITHPTTYPEVFIAAITPTALKLYLALTNASYI